ncbi:MAG TPA: HD domain-containing phosphohydrolase [Luteibacter sp.]|jgi:HD-GYP domain-containing protein (c-di-GMP phosphodiesterase class II)|nr:HD domain-containing phosphohydrolase [Luteibacter sp.]
MQSDETTIRAFDAVKALAFIGDLSMGQPTDHSLRTAWLAGRLAQAAGLDDEACATAAEASLLRWSGCTANAAGFAQVMGDDIAGREAMLAQRADWAEPLQSHGGTETALTPLAHIHCEVSGEVARMLDLGETTQATLRNIFEAWDGHGIPSHAQGNAIPTPVFVVSMAGDLEIFGRIYGLDGALTLIAQRAGSRYPDELGTLAATHAASWLAELDRMPEGELDVPLLTPRMREPTAPELIADVIDLKLPWMTGFSREVASTAASCSARMSLDTQARELVYLAGLVHGIGRTAVPNTTWNTPGKLSTSAWEKLRLVPYWTSRAGKQTGALRQAAELASHAYERLDGSGYFRGASHALTLEARILAASIAWVALRSARPWREAFSTVAAAALLREEAANGRFDSHVVEALLTNDMVPTTRRHRQASSIQLSARELDVLRLIGHGSSNKEAARQLTLSPSTVRTHVESVFRKLECSTRATAVLKASAMGIM